MESRIKCPNCGQEYVIDNSFIGQTVICEKCGTKFTARKIAAASPTPNASPNSILFNPKKPKTYSLPPKYSRQRQANSTAVSPDPIENPPADYYSTNGIWNWITAFFKFKIMITPSWVRISFFLDFVIGVLFITIWPLKNIDRFINVNDSKQILAFALIYALDVLLGIPLLAVILHMIHEMTMIPFSILNVLLEIRNKLDKKTQN